jgi:putative transposase
MHCRAVDGHKALLYIMNIGGESTEAWRQFLDDLDKRGLKRPQFVIVDGAPGLEVCAGHCFPDDWLVALWGDDLPIQRCTVHKHRNLLAHAPKHMHEELGNDYRDMIYAATAAAVETRRKAFVRNWRLKCLAAADSLEGAGDRLFTFTRLDPSQWKAARTTNAIERLNEEFHRRIKTQAVLPCAETVPMLACAPLPPTVSGQTPITVQSPGSSDGAVLAAAVIAGAGLFSLR